MRVEGLADSVRREQRRLESAGTSVDWHSSAAKAFIRRADDASGLLAGDVARLEELAEALRGHAVHVERNLELLEAARRRAVAIAEAGVDLAQDTAGDVADAVDDAAGEAAKAVDKGRRWIGDHSLW